MSARRLATFALALGLVTLWAAPVAAHEGGEASGVSVEPTQVTAGATVVLAGRGLEPNTERVLQLVGHDLIVQFGTVTTDADGMFAKELTIPAHLPAGSYELQAIGDETLSTPIGVSAAAGAVTATKRGQDETIASRSRSPLELAALVVLVLMVAGAGLVLARRADRLGHPGAV